MNNPMYNIDDLTIHQFNILSNIEDSGGQALPQDLIAMDENIDNIKKQYKQLYLFVKQLESDIEGCEKEKNRLQDIISRKKNSIAKIKDFMRYNLKSLLELNVIEEKPSLKLDTVTIFVVTRDDYACSIDEIKYKEIVDNLPEEYVTMDIVKKPRLKDLSKAYQEGKLPKIDGIEFKQSEYVSWR